MFWLGVLIGLILFLPLLEVGLFLLRWFEQPYVSFGRNYSLVNIAHHADKTQSLHFLTDVGIKWRHLRGDWYWVWRDTAPKEGDGE